MRDPSPINERRPPLHASLPAHRKATWWLAAIVGFLALLLATPAISHAEESNPNTYNCLGSIGAGEVEEGSEEQQVKYQFYCDGPITGYQLQAQVPLTGIAGQPPVVLCAPQIRLAFRRFFETTFSELTVLAYTEVPARVEIQSSGTIPCPE